MSKVGRIKYHLNFYCFFLLFNISSLMDIKSYWRHIFKDSFTTSLHGIELLMLFYLPRIPTVDRNLDGSLFLMKSMNFFITTSASHWPSWISRTSLCLGRILGSLLMSFTAMIATGPNSGALNLVPFIGNIPPEKQLFLTLFPSCGRHCGSPCRFPFICSVLFYLNQSNTRVIGFISNNWNVLFSKYILSLKK